MLGIVLIYFIGKQYYTLAEDRNMNKWLYAFVGIGIYYLGTIIGATLIIFYTEFFGNGIDSINDKALGYMSIPFGIFSVWGLYKILDKKWTDKKIDPIEEIALIGKSEDDIEKDVTNEENEVYF